MSEVLNSTLPQEHLDQINHWIPLLVSLMSNGTPNEIAKGLESQFVDRSTEHLYLEKNLSDTQRSIDNLIAAIEQGIITPSTKQRLETLEVTKRELEDKILIEKMKRPLRTEDELWAWFRYMRNFDLTRLEERRQLIDVFVNTVFLYNDRFLLTLNFGYGSKTVLFTDIPCSDKVACGRPKIKAEDNILCLDFS